MEHTSRLKSYSSQEEIFSVLSACQGVALAKTGVLRG